MISTRSTISLGIWVICCLSTAVALLPAADGPLDLYFPVFESGSQEFLGLALVNTSGSVNIVSFGWTSGDGSKFRSGLVTLLPGTQSASLLRELLMTPDDPPDGWIRVHASAPGLLAYLTSGTDMVLDGVEPVSQPATA